jgi:DNA-binding NarL/FixJ family response regulator
LHALQTKARKAVFAVLLFLASECHVTKVNEEIGRMHMSFEDRMAVNVIVVESEPDDRQRMREILESLNFGGVNCQPDHVKAIEVFKERPFTHCIFSSKITTMPPREFLAQILTIDPKLVALPTAFDPQIDDIFELLKIGARGYITRPFSPDAMDQAILMASEGEPFSDAILNAKNRNEAFSALTAATLDKLATTKRQSAKYVTALAELPKFQIDFEAAVKFGRSFSEGGDEAFQESLVEFFCKLAEGPASRLGRLRKRLNTTRKVEEKVEVSQTPSSEKTSE